MYYSQEAEKSILHLQIYNSKFGTDQKGKVVQLTLQTQTNYSTERGKHTDMTTVSNMLKLINHMHRWLNAGLVTPAIKQYGYLH